MRVLILINNLGGLYHFRRELLAEIAKEHEVVFDAPQDNHIDELESLGARYSLNRHLDRRGTNPIKDYRLLKHYLHLISTFRPHVVLTYTIKPNVYGGIACALRRVQYVANITGLGSSIQNGGPLQRLTLFLYRLGLMKARVVFFQNSDNMRFFHDKGIVPGRAVLLPGSGVNTDYFRLQEYPDDNSGIHLIYIGRVMTDKGSNELICAAKTLKERHPNLSITLLGPLDEAYEEKISSANALGIIEYVPRQSDVRPYLASAHALVNPSYHEGMSNVCLEAAASGRPVIASNIPGCHETFDEGVTGIGFEPKNVRSLVEALERFVTLPWEKKRAMGLAGRKKVVREFDRQIVVNKYLEEIEDIEKESKNA